MDTTATPPAPRLRSGDARPGTPDTRNAQAPPALTGLLPWARRHSLAIAIEDLDFQADTTREKHGRRKPIRT